MEAEGRGAKPACHASGRLDDRRGNGAAVDMRATAPNWPTFSDRRDKECVRTVRRNECADGAAPDHRRNCRRCELSRLQEIAADHRSHTSSWMSIRARRFVQNTGRGGVAGASPAEGVGRDLGSAAGEGFPRLCFQIAAKILPISGPLTSNWPTPIVPIVRDRGWHVRAICGAAGRRSPF
jgi:hypothetical protein